MIFEIKFKAILYEQLSYLNFLLQNILSSLITQHFITPYQMNFVCFQKNKLFQDEGLLFWEYPKECAAVCEGISP